MPVLYHLSLPALTPVRPQLGKLKKKNRKQFLNLQFILNLGAPGLGEEGKLQQFLV